MPRSVTHRWLAAACALMLLAGCASAGSGERAVDSGNDSNAGTVTGGSSPDTKGDWTVFVYLNGDNNLEPAALMDLQQMTKARGTTFIALVDRSPDYADQSVLNLGNFSDSRLIRIVDGKTSVLEKPGELNMGDARTLQAFIGSTMPKYASAHNALVVWDHGGAWRGAAWDESSDNDNLSLPELDQAIGAGLADAKQKKFDLIGFDACLMSTYEVAATLKSHADYLLASEEVEPGGGWDWGTLSTKGGATTRELAAAIIKGFTAESAEGGADDTTLALLQLNKVDGVTNAINNLTKAARTSKAREAPGRIAYGRSSSISFGRDPNPELDYFMVDLGDLAKRLYSVPGLSDAAKGLAAALNKVVVMRGNGPIAADASGMAAYFPPTRALFQTAYGDIPVAKPWNRFVTTYFKVADDVPDDELPMFIDQDRLLETGDQGVDENEDHVQLTARVSKGTGGNIANALITWGQVSLEDSNQVVYFGERNATVAGDQVRGVYDWNALRISDGHSTTYAYASLTFGPDKKLARVEIPITFRRGGDEADGTLRLGVRDGKIIAETFYIRVDDAIAPVVPEEGDTFVPVLHHQDLSTEAEEWFAATDTPLSAERSSLDFSYGKMPSNSAILLGLQITDLTGQNDFSFYGAASP